MLPGAFPNLLANGAAGIAVGMATSIPPHNAGEICAAAIHLIQQPERDHRRAAAAHARARISRPAACWSRTRPRILAAYETGRGGFRAARQVGGGEGQARHLADRRHRNPLSGAEGQADRADRRSCMEEKKLPLLGDMRDESTEAVRLVLEPKTRGVEPEVLMETLFRATALETRFPLNMNVLDATRTPRVMELREVLRAWLDHRHEVLVRRSQPPAGRDRAADRDPRRLSARLPQPRRGDPHHPRGGRAEAAR